MENKENHCYCRINGRIEDLMDVQELLDREPYNYGDVVRLMLNKYEMDGVKAVVFEEMVREDGIPADFDEVYRKRLEECRQRPSCYVRCKYCNSANVTKLGAFEKASWYHLGREWHCNNCGSDF